MRKNLFHMFQKFFPHVLWCYMHIWVRGSNFFLRVNLLIKFWSLYGNVFCFHCILSFVSYKIYSTNEMPLCKSHRDAFLFHFLLFLNSISLQFEPNFDYSYLPPCEAHWGAIFHLLMHFELYIDSTCKIALCNSYRGVMVFFFDELRTQFQWILTKIPNHERKNKLILGFVHMVCSRISESKIVLNMKIAVIGG